MLQIIMPIDAFNWGPLDETIIKRVASFRALQSVTVQKVCVPWSFITVKEIATALGSLPNLLSLELIDIPFHSFIPLQHIMAVCHGLERLYICNVEYVVNDDDDEDNDISPTYAQSPPSPCASLKLLSVVASSFRRQFLNWIWPASSQLVIICVDFETILQNAKTFGGLIRDMGSTLKKLCIMDQPMINGLRRTSPLPVQLCFQDFTIVIRFFIKRH